MDKLCVAAWHYELEKISKLVSPIPVDGFIAEIDC